MENLTTEQKNQIAIEMIKEQPLQTLGHITLLKLSEIGINTNAENVTMSTKADFLGKRYNCKLIITWELI